MQLNDQITELSGIGASLAEKFGKLGIYNVEQLLTYYPRKYDDYSEITPISRIKPGVASVKAKFSNVVKRRSRGGLHITEALASDDSGSIRIIWFNQPYRAQSIKIGAEYFISGEFGLSRQRMSMVNPSAELASDFPINTARIIPMYKETKGLKSSQIRRGVKNALPYLSVLKESLPEWLIAKYNLIALGRAIETIHFPLSAEELEKAKFRVGFEEVFDLSLAALINKNELLKNKAPAIRFQEKLAKDYVSNLPFKLTDEQRRVAWQIFIDMQKTVPMNRLLEGDVGTGKTVVATMAAVMAMKQGFQVVFMAPTELLARQHADTILEILGPLKLADKVDLLIGSHTKAQKNAAASHLLSGDTMLIIGTHSLLQDNISLKKLGLVVIDEQHRFGVKQRQALLLKSGHMPHVLSMTATPIPRSLQLTIYGDLDVSIIKAKPYTTLPIQTAIINLNSRTKTYESLTSRLDKSEQVFVVCPLISEAFELPFRSAEKVYEELKKGVYQKYRVGLLHGKLKTDEKEKVMNDFVNHKLDVLVATTIIEVGVNVPNASVMMIESPERFGLAQIHQLRGRVGRSDKQGYCYLLLDDNNQPSNRLRALETTQDGFSLAELDLTIRGPGVVYGIMQHGRSEFDLKVAKLNDQKLILNARQAAQEFIDKHENLLQYIQLSERVNRLRSITNLN